MSIVTRKGKEEDFPAVFSLIKEFALFQKTPEKLITTADQMIKEKDLFQCVVAEHPEEGIIGFASYFFAYYSWSGKALYLDDLYVKANYRGEKTGTQLFNAVIELARESACKNLRWQVSNWNEKAKAFYKKMGAVIDDVEVNCILKLQ